MAAVPEKTGDFVRSLFVTLRRGLAGKPWFHKRIIQALGLRTRHQCVEKPNTDTIRGMLMKVGGGCLRGASGCWPGQQQHTGYKHPLLLPRYTSAHPTSACNRAFIHLSPRAYTCFYHRCLT